MRSNGAGRANYQGPWPLDVYGGMRTGERACRCRCGEARMETEQGTYGAAHAQMKAFFATGATLAPDFRKK